jgi:hypothetical protein
LFLVVELVRALDGKIGGTLSEWVWAIFAIDLKPRRFAFLRRASLSAFLFALTLHFLVKSSVVPVIVFGALVAWWIYYWFKNERGKL